MNNIRVKINVTIEYRDIDRVATVSMDTADRDIAMLGHEYYLDELLFIHDLMTRANLFISSQQT